MANIISLTNGVDFNSGTAANDEIYGYGGNDVLEGGGGNDWIHGGAGNDTLRTLLGMDTLIGGEGDDTLRDESTTPGSTLVGDVGADTYWATQSTKMYENAGGGVDTVNMKVVYGTSFTLGANFENLNLWDYKFGAGADITKGATLIGNGLANTINGGSLGDTIRGEAGADRLFGHGGADVLLGGSGNDTLNGGAGADRVSGGAGQDALWGGADVDRFVFSAVGDSASGKADMIHDFAKGEKIDLSAIDAKAGGGANDAFGFVAAKPFFASEGELWAEKDVAANLTRVYGDVNGDGLADLAINIRGVFDLSQTDFIL